VPLEIVISLFEKHHLHKALEICKFNCAVENYGSAPVALSHVTATGSIALMVTLVPSEFSPSQVKERGLRSTLKGKYDNTKDKLRPKYPIYTYHKIVGELNTGDVILFRGIEMHSKIIQAGTMSYWSHAAILIRDPPEDIKELFGVHKFDEVLEKAGQTWDKNSILENIYVYESDYLPIDLREGGGCQLVPLKVWLIDYEDYYSRMHCIIRRLQVPKRKITINNHSLWEWMRKTATISYKISTREMVLALGKLNRQENLQSVFCSELVAATLKYMGLLPENINASNFTPKDFDKITYGNRLHFNHSGKDDLELLFNAQLMEPIRIVFNHQKHSPKISLRLDIHPIIKREEPE